MKVERIRFEEFQQFREAWHWILLLGIPLGIMFFVASVMAYDGKANAIPGVLALIVLITLLLALLMYFARLKVRVTDHELRIVFVPFLSRRIPLNEIENSEAITYAWADSGGWGVHYSFTGYGWAYNVSGHRGVAIRLKNGKRLLIGSQRADELASAICGGGAAGV